MTPDRYTHSRLVFYLRNPGRWSHRFNRGRQSLDGANCITNEAVAFGYNAVVRVILPLIDTEKSLFRPLFIALCALLGLAIGAALFSWQSGAPPTLWQRVVEPAREWSGNKELQYRPNSYAAGIQQVAPSVVSIYTSETIYKSPEQDPLSAGNSIAPPERRQTNQGSGVTISADGYILTSNHLIDEADEIYVALPDGRLFPATKIGHDHETDLAVVKISTPDELPWCSIELKTSLQIGDIVLAIGNPYGVGQTVTQGIVSALSRQITGVSSLQNFVQIDAAINPGNSGGALINPDGALVGINTAVYSRLNGAQGIGFAIPTELVREVVPQILEHGRVIRGWLGLGVEDLNSHPALYKLTSTGAVVAGLFRDSPAHLAGLRRGDIITEIDEEPIARASQLLTTIAAKQPGTSITLKGIRDAQPFEADVTLTERPIFRDRES